MTVSSGQTVAKEMAAYPAEYRVELTRMSNGGAQHAE